MGRDLELEMDIIRFLEDNIRIADLIVVFFSPNSIKSKFVETEWLSTFAIKKPIIPVYSDSENIPPILMSQRGVKFDEYDIEKSVQTLYEVILSKVKSK